MNARFLLFIGLLLAAFTAGANAHELRPGYLEINQTADKEYSVAWKAPIRLGRPLSVEPQFPADCSAGERSARETDRAAILTVWVTVCEAPLQGRSIALAGLEATLTDILIRFRGDDDEVQAIRATPENPIAIIEEEPSAWQIAKTYFNFGVEHIFDGVDHLLFVLALVLLITGVRKLVETITAFTVAHSLTLAGTALGLFSLPQAPVEAVIALSIVFLASELANKQAGQPRLSEQYPWLVAFSFGLLHGFGFAGALKEIGLPSGDVAVALLTFNLGVEAGQLMFVAVVLLALAAITRITPRHRIDYLASYLIGIPAAFWLVERVV